MITVTRMATGPRMAAGPGAVSTSGVVPNAVLVGLPVALDSRAAGISAGTVRSVGWTGHGESSSSVAMRDRWISWRRQCSSSGSGKRSASR